MYFQVYFRNDLRDTFGQVSCDTFDEITIELERLGKPRFVTVEYHNENGIFGIANKMYITTKDFYETFSKKRFQ